MRNRSKLLLAGFCATLLLGTSVGAASATMLTFNQRNFAIRWSTLVFEAAGQNLTCGLSLGGSFHSNVISKTFGALVGHVNTAGIASPNCTGGTATVLRGTLPWHLQYSSFQGALPVIRSVVLALVGARFQFNPGVTCLTGTTQTEPMSGVLNLESRGAVTSYTASGSIGLQGGFLCSIAGRGMWSGTGTFTEVGGGPEVIKLEGVFLSPTLRPTPVEFGRVEPETVISRTMTITAGTEVLTVNRITLARGRFFAITDPRSCLGARLAARETCTFRAIFSAPEEAGRAVEDTVTVETTVEALRATLRGST